MPYIGNQSETFTTLAQAATRGETDLLQEDAAYRRAPVTCGLDLKLHVSGYVPLEIHTLAEGADLAIVQDVAARVQDLNFLADS